MVLGLGKLFNGLAGNMNEQSVDRLTRDYGQYLIANESIQTGYVLVRDVVLFTDIRIIFIDKQGATGIKTSVQSIFLMNIVGVEMESAGFGIDDAELKIIYMENVQRRAHQEVLDSVTFEFPKSVNILPLYQFLLELAYNNRLEINQL